MAKGDMEGLTNVAEVGYMDRAGLDGKTGLREAGLLGQDGDWVERKKVSLRCVAFVG